jgi:hypothetical protein
MGKDSVTLDSEVRRASGQSGGELNWKRGLLLFVVVLFVMSDLFLNNFASFIPGAVEGREASDVGYLIQAVSAVMLYAGVMYLCDHGVL